MFYMAFLVGSLLAGFAMGDTFLEIVGYATVVWFALNITVYVTVILIGLVMEWRS